MDLEELAFKNANELTELSKEELLMIIALLQQDRKCWIEQYTRGHNHLVDIQLRINKILEYISEPNDFLNSEEMKYIKEILKGGSNE